MWEQEREKYQTPRNGITKIYKRLRDVLVIVRSSVLQRKLQSVERCEEGVKMNEISPTRRVCLIVGKTDTAGKRERASERERRKPLENGCENRFLSRVRSAVMRECEP